MGPPPEGETHTPQEPDILAGEDPHHVVLLVALDADCAVIEVGVCLLQGKHRHASHGLKPKLYVNGGGDPARHLPAASTVSKRLPSEQ